jgi:hypothetical protein
MYRSKRSGSCTALSYLNVNEAEVYV